MTRTSPSAGKREKERERRGKRGGKEYMPEVLYQLVKEGTEREREGKEGEGGERERVHACSPAPAGRGGR